MRRNRIAIRAVLAAPWWLVLLASPVVYVLMAYVVPLRATKNPFGAAVGALTAQLGLFAAGAIVFLAMMLAFHQRRARRLLDQQTDLDSIRSLTWRDFERLVAEAYRRQNYSVVENGGGGADGGVDLVLRREGTVLVQCKRWKTYRVGVKEVRELFGILSAEKAARAILITSGRFTDDARAFAAGKPLDLIDGGDLLELVRSVREGAPPASLPGLRPSAAQATAQASSGLAAGSATRACPRCGESMVLRSARQGVRAGTRFWGCSTFPKCRGTVEVSM